MLALAPRLLKAEQAAVAPIVALSLFALVGAGGIAFDYARLASMDSELQNAADQAALAAASQLDGKAGACSRAALAASSLIANNTRFANDGSGIAINVANESACDRTGAIRFYSTKDKSDTGTMNDASAKFVEIMVGGRTAFYALTPVVGAFSSGAIAAVAFAGVNSSICGAVPFFICSPDEPVGNTDPYRLVTIPTGTGISMLEGGTQWGPGNFGFLDQLGKGANGVKEALSANALFSPCQATDNVVTEPGQMSSFRASFNMRFDFTGTGGSCPDGPCSPSTNVRKDMVRKDDNNCSWDQNPADASNYATRRYRPTTAAALPLSVTPEIMGPPRDLCHATGATSLCAKGRVGDGVWDRAAYFRSNHPGLAWQTTAGLGANVTRYATYLWEAAEDAVNPPLRKASSANASIPSAANKLYAFDTPQTGKCLAPGIMPDINGTDRRRVTAATVNCRIVSATTGLNGKKTIPVAGYVDVFLVEPSKDRTRCDGNGDVDLNGDGDTNDAGEKKGCAAAFTDANDVYVEVIGASGSGAGGGAGQITRRDVPYLIE